MMRLLSIQTSMPKILGEGSSPNPMFGRWSTGIFKQPVSGPVHVARLNLEGDGQADLTVHGGPDKAVYAYPAQYYPLWRAELDLPDMTYGGFGENFTIDGATEKDVCIGDVHRIGTAVLEVSQPRMPCWKLARKWNMTRLPALFVQTGRSGWYYRVREEGTVAAGEHVELVTRTFPQWTIWRTCELTYQSGREPDMRVEAKELLNCPELAEQWKAALAERFAYHAQSPSVLLRGHCPCPRSQIRC